MRAIFGTIFILYLDSVPQQHDLYKKAANTSSRVAQVRQCQPSMFVQPILVPDSLRIWATFFWGGALLLLLNNTAVKRYDGSSFAKGGDNVNGLISDVLPKG